MRNNYNELEVYIYGEKVGTLFDDGIKITFVYSHKFRARDLEISPLKLKLSEHTKPYTNEESPEIYHQLPGVIRDSLPDTNGQKIMDKYFAAIDINPSTVSILQRLAFIGDRGIGALEYRPKEHESKETDLSVTASELYLKDKELHNHESIIDYDTLMTRMVDSASPVGGAKNKILIYFNADTKELKFFNNKNTQFKASLLKFDNEAIYKEDTKMEYIYMTLARLGGIDVMDFDLIQDGNMQHYITQRFDRIEDKKIHSATASALLHKPHVSDGITYEELIRLTFSITNSISDVKRLIKQMMFNILYAVTDDHSKNFSFLMDEKGVWSLAPAYDLIYTHGLGAINHKTSLGGKNNDFVLHDVVKVASQYHITLDEVIDCFQDLIVPYIENFDALTKETNLSSASKNGIKDTVKKRIESFIV